MHIPRLILDIAFLQRGPQALPASTGLTITALASYAAAGVLAHHLMVPAKSPVGPVLLDLVLLTGFVLFLLYSRGFPGRSFQTLTALGGTGTLLTLCALPVIRMLDSTAGGAPLASTGVVLWLALMIWSVFVTAHILRHALAIGFSAGLFLALGYMMVSLFLYASLFETAR